jgi:hypothetical protein
MTPFFSPGAPQIFERESSLGLCRSRDSSLTLGLLNSLVTESSVARASARAPAPGKPNRAALLGGRATES